MIDEGTDTPPAASTARETVKLAPPAPEQPYDHRQWARALKRAEPRMPLTSREKDVALLFHEHANYQTGETYVGVNCIARLAGHDKPNHIHVIRRKLIRLGMVYGPYSKVGYRQKWYRLLMPDRWVTGGVSDGVTDAENLGPKNGPDWDQSRDQKESQFGTESSPKSGLKRVPNRDRAHNEGSYQLTLYPNNCIDQQQDEEARGESEQEKSVIPEAMRIADSMDPLMAELSHTSWGIGPVRARELVLNYDRDQLVIAFDNFRRLYAGGKRFTNAGGWIADQIRRSLAVGHHGVQAPMPSPTMIDRLQTERTQAAELQAQQAAADRFIESLSEEDRAKFIAFAMSADLPVPMKSKWAALGLASPRLRVWIYEQIKTGALSPQGVQPC